MRKVKMKQIQDVFMRHPVHWEGWWLAYILCEFDIVRSADSTLTIRDYNIDFLPQTHLSVTRLETEQYICNQKKQTY